MPFPTTTLTTWAKPKPRPSSSQTISSVLSPPTSPDAFGLPCASDPDPFGVLALEQAGLSICEAGSRSRPSSDAFEYRPSPRSPIFSNFGRHSVQSIDSVSLRNSRRDSRRSVKSVDCGTQTGAGLGIEVIREVEVSKESSPARKTTEDLAGVDDENRVEEPCQEEVEAIDRVEEEDDEEPEVVIASAAPAVQQYIAHTAAAQVVIASAAPAVQQYIAHTAAAQVVTRAKLVNIHKRIPPTLPPRSPYRRRIPESTSEEPQHEQLPQPSPDDEHSSHYSSPTKSTFDRSSMDSPNPWSEVPTTPDGESLAARDEGNVQAEMGDGRTGKGREDTPRAEPDLGAEDERFEDVDLQSAQAHSTGPAPRSSLLITGDQGGAESEVFHSMPPTPIEPAGAHRRDGAYEDFL